VNFPRTFRAIFCPFDLPLTLLTVRTIRKGSDTENDTKSETGFDTRNDTSFDTGRIQKKTSTPLKFQMENSKPPRFFLQRQTLGTLEVISDVLDGLTIGGTSGAGLSAWADKPWLSLVLIIGTVGLQLLKRLLASIISRSVVTNPINTTEHTTVSMPEPIVPPSSDEPVAAPASTIISAIVLLLLFNTSSFAQRVDTIRADEMPPFDYFEYERQAAKMHQMQQNYLDRRKDLQLVDRHESILKETRKWLDTQDQMVPLIQSQFAPQWPTERRWDELYHDAPSVFVRYGNLIKQAAERYGGDAPVTLTRKQYNDILERLRKLEANKHH
jgi:hypothetical protein